MISAFGTGIINFTMVDIPLEKVMGNIPKEIQQHILSDIENKQAELRKAGQDKGLVLVMRSNSDFFMITLEKDALPKCQTIEFSHGRKDILFQISEESDGIVRILDL